MQLQFGRLELAARISRERELSKLGVFGMQHGGGDFEAKHLFKVVAVLMEAGSPHHRVRNFRKVSFGLSKPIPARPAGVSADRGIGNDEVLETLDGNNDVEHLPVERTHCNCPVVRIERPCPVKFGADTRTA